MDGSFDVYKSKSYSEEAKWICIYPLYLNARKTIAHGRRIRKEKAVDSPTSQEIFDVLTNAGFKAKLELPTDGVASVALPASPRSLWHKRSALSDGIDALITIAWQCSHCTNAAFIRNQLHRLCWCTSPIIRKHVMHPLDPNRDTNAQGRVRVQLRNDDGTPINDKFPTRMSLMLYACEMIPKLKNRQTGSGSGPQTAAASGKANKKHKKR